MFCTNCGKQLVDGAYACPYCGNVVESAVKAKPAEAPAPAVEAKPETPAAPAEQPAAKPVTAQPTYDPYSQPQYDPAAQAPVEPQKPVRTHPLTIIGFVCSFLYPLVGLILCLIAKSKMKKDPSIAGGRGMNKAGIILSIIGIVLTALVAIIYIFLFAIIIASGENIDFEYYMSLFNMI